MDFADTVKRQLATRAYWNFRGRASPSEYWLFVLFIMASSTAVSFTCAILDMSGTVSDLWSLFLAVPFLAATFRRLHDTGRSGLILLLVIASGTGAWLFISRSIILAIYNPGFGMWRLLDDPNLVAGLSFLAAFAVLSIVMLVLLILPSRPGANKYGQPHGAAQG